MKALFYRLRKRRSGHDKCRQVQGLLGDIAAGIGDTVT